MNGIWCIACHKRYRRFGRWYCELCDRPTPNQEGETPC